jgi:hypothetical protein
MASLPKPDRLEFYKAPVPGDDSTLVARYVYGLVTEDWPVDVYYGDSGLVADIWANDNPSLASARRLSGRPGAILHAGTTPGDAVKEA